MGAVHGVYLKYVGLSALSYAGYASIVRIPEDGMVFQSMNRGLFYHQQLSPWRLAVAAILGYSTIVNGLIAALFKLRRGMKLIGKDAQNGQIPLWSYIVFFPFYIPTILYTYIHTKMGTYKPENSKAVIVPVASEVQPGWFVGGRYAHLLDKDWSGIVDLTVEFPELCIHRTKEYLLIPVWDGVPPSPAQIEEAAVFASNAQKKGDVIIHCAHGRGRSTTVMCAALVRAGLFETWQEAFEKGVKPYRPVCKLNSKMKAALTAWQKEYVDEKKEK